MGVGCLVSGMGVAGCSGRMGRGSLCSSSSGVRVPVGCMAMERVVKLEDLLRAPNQRMVGEVDDLSILVFQEPGTQTLRATASRCPHLGVSLGTASCVKGVLTCSQHGSSWDLAKGGAVDAWLPGDFPSGNFFQRAVSKPCPLPAYACELDDEGWVVVDLPAATSV